MKKRLETRKSMRNYQLVGVLGLIVVAGGIGAWAALSSIQGAIIASGVTRVETSSKKIQHREGGIIRKIAVKEGQLVKAGDLLIELDQTEAKARHSIVASLVVEGLAQKARLEAMRDETAKITFPAELLDRQSEPTIAGLITAQQKLFAAQRAAQKGRQEQLEQRIEQLKEEIAGLKSQTVSRKEQVDLITRELVDLTKLQKKGLVPVTRLLALQRQKANLEGQQGQLVANIAQTKSRIGETRLQIIQLNDDVRSKTLAELRDVNAKLKESRERAIALTAVLSRTKINAPRTGYVHQLAFHTIGGVIGPGQVIMNIVPELDDLIIEARVKPQDIDSIHISQKARIRFPSFNARTTPEVSGSVFHVAADLTQVDNQTPPFFAIKVKIKKSELEKLGKDNKLIPGMPAETFIQTRARTPLSYLIQPLRDQIMRTFREE
jgi:HlyD family secretion protein